MKKLLFILLFAICFISLMMAQSTQNSSGQIIPVKIKTKNISETPHRVPMFINIQVIYQIEDNSIIINSDNINAEAFISYNGNEIDYSSSIPAVFYLPFNDGCYTITIVGGSWTAEGCLEL